MNRKNLLDTRIVFGASLYCLSLLPGSCIPFFFDPQGISVTLIFKVFYYVLDSYVFVCLRKWENKILQRFLEIL
jgi:hypothetical protein